MSQIDSRWSGKRFQIYTLLSLLFALTTGLISLFFPKGTLLIEFAQHRTPFLNETVLWITRMGEEHIYLAAIIIALFFSYRHSAAFSLAGVLSLVLSFLLKSLFAQPRPLLYFLESGNPGVLGSIEGYAFHSAYTSMPSGHTLAAFSFFYVVAFAGKKVWLQSLVFILAAMVGMSRIYLGQHFAADVSAGTLTGLAIGWLSTFLAYSVWSDKKKLDRSFLRP